MINLITRISVIGIAAITAALIILLSAFNGIEDMIEKLYSEFDSDITIRAEYGKTFNENRINLEELSEIAGVANYSRAIEEVIILKHEQKWVNANLYGVDTSFLTIAHMDSHMIDGESYLYNQGNQYGLIGATLLDKLDGFIPDKVGNESVICYVPKKNIKIRPGKSPFKSKVVKLSGRFNFNREVNANAFIIPIKLASDILASGNQISALYIDAREGIENEVLKQEIKKIIGPGFKVKTNFEKNELIYKTSKSEKVIVLIILLFIFILAAFNLVATLTMLFIEKLPNISTIRSFGASREMIFKIFFIEGLMISFKGILFGVVAGYLVCLAQIQFHLVSMPNSGGEPFPVHLSFGDGVMIVSLVSLLSILFSYFPVKYLIKKNLNKA